MKQFNKWNIPQEGRFMMLDSDMYDQLFESMTDAERNNFLFCANLEKGIIGKYKTFTFFQRSQVAKTAGDKTLKPFEALAETDDCAAGIAWYRGSVSRALGETVPFEDENNPLYYSDILSFLQRAGGRYIRADKKRSTVNQTSC
ncbi:MAG: hypothetical protein LUE98_07730 [Tannerellaceae bacterium]|nr:hypothetical protein [Tannerellaceae bacterium]